MKLVKKHYLFVALNLISITLLIVWIFKRGTSPATSLISIIMDFSVLITCIYSLIRVGQSLKGNFKIIDMVTVYYASLFFLFFWFIKMLYLVWDHFYMKDHDDINMIISIMVFITLVINFYTTEKVNMENLDKIESM